MFPAIGLFVVFIYCRHTPADIGLVRHFHHHITELSLITFVTTIFHLRHEPDTIV